MSADSMTEVVRSLSCRNHSKRLPPETRTEARTTLYVRFCRNLSHRSRHWARTLPQWHRCRSKALGCPLCQPQALEQNELEDDLSKTTATTTPGTSTWWRWQFHSSSLVFLQLRGLYSHSYVLYLVLWLVSPEDDDETENPCARRRPVVKQCRWCLDQCEGSRRLLK